MIDIIPPFEDRDSFFDPFTIAITSRRREADHRSDIMIVQRLLLLALAFASTFVFTFMLSSTVRAEVEVGDRPELDLTDLDGEEIALGELRGKVVLVDFWATWCAPCRRSMPAYQKFYDEYRDDGLRILAVSVDESRSAVDEFRRRHGLTVAIMLDEEHRTAEEFAPPTMPTTYLVDREGVVRYRHAGFRDGDAEEIEAKIRELLGEHAPPAP